MNRGTTTMRRLGAAAGLTLAAGMLTACGGDGPGGPPDDASVADFCESINPQNALEGMDIGPESSEEEQRQAIEDALTRWRDNIEETGTPEDIPDAARDGYEEVLEQFDEIDFDQSLEDLGKQLEEFDDASPDVKALEEYVEKECDITM